MTQPISLPETGFLRLWQIIGDKKADPRVPGVFPVGKSKWWEGVRTGRYPKGYKLSANITAWRVEDIRRLIEEQTNSTPAPPRAAIEAAKRKRAAQRTPAITAPSPRPHKRPRAPPRRSK
jgi:prophage regulatory protein